MPVDPALLNEAARRAQGPDPASARPLVQRLLGLAPDNPDVLTLSGLVAQRSGDANAALDAFARARAADPANPARISNHGLALKACGRFEEAVVALRDALAIRPDAPVTLANLAACLIAADREAQAEAPLRAALAARPDHAEAWNNLGIVLARTGRHREAIDAYAQALAKRPDWPEASLNLAEALTASGRADEAQARISSVLARHPGHPRAANLLAARAEAAGDAAAAAAIYRDALAHGFSHPVAHNLVLALLRLDRPADALAVAERMLAESPAVTTPLALICAALERLGRAEELKALCALDCFVTVEQPGTPSGFASAPAFHAALEAELRAHPSLTFEPAGLVTRSGRQSGELADAQSPGLAALARMATGALSRRHAELGGQDHPWLRARPEHWCLTLWGTILAPGGAVEPHIHAPNWLSGVYYPALPENVSGGTEGGFAIGLLPAALGGGGSVHAFPAAEGRMILFPSFLWHATLPFTGPAERISFAFDLVPEGIGRPHRLRP